MSDNQAYDHWQRRAEKAEAELARYKEVLAYVVRCAHENYMPYLPDIDKLLTARPAPDSDNHELYGIGYATLSQPEQIRKNQEMRAKLDQLPLAAGPEQEQK